ncbi:erythromycin esterase family protein [Lentzea californiensis]|uniref:erythromycin esterase family protein n=1 Tax=Lentzea californiensis TaxID=438851 RepID=UPI002166368C|nr:erythromycin esterase family protein [Lentzea californiensis]MCR3750448.1 Erythromycin esterase homolog [Lentzea californiensis]
MNGHRPDGVAPDALPVTNRFDDEVAALCAPLTDPGDLDELLDRIGDARVVMIGEASHGTHEFYRWRAALTQRLITEKAFSFVAVEGDWPDCDRVDRAVRCSAGAPEDPRAALLAYDRWPTWMWANEEVADFTRWLRRHNSAVDDGERVGFHGLDVYSLWESLREIMVHLREHDPGEVPAALAAYHCFEPYGESARDYAMATRLVPAGCENEVVDLLVRLRDRAATEDTGSFGAWQNAEVVAGAERYYRAMTAGGPGSWNIRETHMDETLHRLLLHYGIGSKAVVWAHNTHVGDARATTMAVSGTINIGQLARERHGDDQVVLIGFGSHHGTVVAGSSWGAPLREMPVPEARPGSLEHALHASAPERALMVFPRSGRPDLLTTELPHRAIGVVYDPVHDHMRNYVPTRLGGRYDAFLWLDETRALHPLHTRQIDTLEPETFPTGD